MKKLFFIWIIAFLALSSANLSALDLKNVTAIEADSNQLWIGGDSCVIRMDRKTNELRYYPVFNLRGLTGERHFNQVKALTLSNDNLWVATRYGMFQLLGDSIQQTDNLDYVNTLLAEANNTVWAGGLRHIAKYVDNELSDKLIIPGHETSSTFAVNSLKFDSKHRLWIATQGGFYYNEEAGKYEGCKLFRLGEDKTSFVPFPNKVNDVASYYGMDIDQNDNLWITSSNNALGIIRYNEADGFTFFTSKDSNIPEDWKVQRVACLGNDVFVGADKGLLRYYGEGFDSYSFEETMTVQTMLIDDGNVYIGTKEHGLWRFRDGQFVRIPLDTDSHSAIQKPTIEMKKPLSYTIDGMPATSHTKGVKVEEGKKIVLFEK